MKRFLVLNRTITNSGDFLINKNVMELLEAYNPNSIFINKSAFERFDLEELNSYDAIIIGGGPGYDDRILNNGDIHLFNQIDEIRIPIHFMGVGWYGCTGLDEIIYNYKFQKNTLEKLQKIVAGGGILGCRDNITEVVLKNNGLSNTIMMGCPVWYDKNYLGEHDIKNNANQIIKKIAISDPGITKNKYEQNTRADQAIHVIQTIKELFREADIIFTFNNGIETKYSKICNNKIKDFLENENIKYKDLSLSADGFSVYDDVDLHVGFRVHSHIYSLSHRIPTLLIEEDARGYGVNESLGLDHIFSYKVTNVLNGTYEPNQFLKEHICYSVQNMIKTDFLKIKNAFRIIDYTYDNSMVKFLGKFR